MKKFIKDYIKIIAISLTGLVFILSSFYLIINYNHSEEIKKTIYIGESDLYYQNQKEALNTLNNNLLAFRNKRIQNQAYRVMAESLGNCYNILESDGAFAKITPNNYYSSYEIHKLGSYFQNKVMNVCYLTNLSYLKGDKIPQEFASIAPFVTSYVDSINKNVGDSLSEIENNSSYFYSTNITSATIRNYLSSSYKTVVGAYNDFATILVDLSNYINGGDSNA